MSQATESVFVGDDTTGFERVAAGVVGVGIVTFLLAAAGLLQFVALGQSVLGTPVYDLFGYGLVAMGVATAGLGIGTRAGVLSADPDDAAGILPGTIFGAIGFATGGLVASQTFGLGTPVWIAAALSLGGAVFALTVFPREDVGSTIPAASFLVFLGGVVLGDVIAVGWAWTTPALTGTFTAEVVLPLLTVMGSLIGVWSAAKAYGGFGPSGRQAGAFLLIGLSVFGILSVLVILVVFVFIKGLPTVLTGADLAQLEIPFIMNVSAGLYVTVPGVLPAILGTIWLVVGTVVIAVPIGVGAAVFLTEYAEQGRFTQVVELATNGLWSTPSVVFGLFGLAFLVPRLGNAPSLLAGQIVLSFMLLPLVIITSRESIKSVPDEYRDASAALGVSRWETIKSVVLPAAMPGIITGVILGVGRIAGETAPILLVMTRSVFPFGTPNVLSGFRFTTSPPFIANDALLQSASALPYQLYATITAGQSPRPELFTAREFGWGTAMILLVVVLGLYAIGVLSRIYFRRKLNA
ncbi:MAG: phosphate ABC transporter permease PstA [Halorientalis sp.]